MFVGSFSLEFKKIFKGASWESLKVQFLEWPRIGLEESRFLDLPHTSPDSYSPKTPISSHPNLQYAVVCSIQGLIFDIYFIKLSSGGRTVDSLFSMGSPKNMFNI